jgi:hypothetical protein
MLASVPQRTNRNRGGRHGGGLKEQRKNGACDTKAGSNKCKMNGQMSVEAVSS